MNMRSYVKCPWPGSATLVLRMGARDSRQHRVAFQPTHVCVSLGSKQANRKNLIARAQRNGRDEGHKACKACEAEGAWPNEILRLLRCGGFADGVWQESGLPATWHQARLLTPTSTHAMVRRHWLAFVLLGLLWHRLAFTGLRWQPAIRPVFRRAGQGPYPELCVFDLDACLWDKEMYEMEAIPQDSDVVLGDLRGRGEGVTGVMSGADKISLHKGAMKALQDHADGKYPGMKIAVASSADTPFAEKVGRKALSLLEVLPGLTVWQLLLRDWEGKDVNQIGGRFYEG
ncbi:hypothetical protein AK812_SmicGene36665 [Symbiodinium microadriaticum]|uniref:Magnesium-dependent phosphatase 1 n=1 Tax=Symbiodinium microadriaticum TaxID=2951 RepID=A0A1Q9CIA5_SYMMI|nr:hypothetical protein AK812_SmicGene36665 [Symbiodinium microadriaticum]